MKILSVLLFVFSFSASAAKDCSSVLHSLKDGFFSTKQIEKLCTGAKDLGPYRCYLESRKISAQLTTELCTNATESNFKQPIDCYFLVPTISDHDAAQLCNSAKNPGVVVRCFNDFNANISRLYRNQGATEVEITEIAINQCRGL